MRAIGYFRVGSGASGSLVEQEAPFFSFCQGMGYEPVATFVDVQPKEGSTYNEYHRMLQYIKGLERGFLVVLAKDLEQLGDSHKDALRRVLELEQLGAKVVCTQQEVTDPVAYALEALTQTRRKGTLSSKVKQAMQQRAMAGAGLGKPPLGYRIGDSSRLEVVQSEAETVKLIYHLYLAETLGIRLIARYLNERNILTRRGGRWSMVSIRDILRNRTYLGTYNRFGIRIPGSHPALISASDFKSVQERLNSQHKPERSVAGQPFLLSGIAYCGYCSNKMIGINRRQSWARSDGSRTQGTYRYYQCQSRTNQSFCDYHTRRAEELEAEVVSELSKHSTPERLEQLAASHRSDSSSRGDDISHFKTRIKALERQVDNYLDRAARGDVNTQQLRSNAGGLLREKADLEERLSLAEAEIKGRALEGRRWQRIIENLQNMASKWQTLPDLNRRTLLQDVVDRVMIFDDRVEIALKW